MNIYQKLLQDPRWKRKRREIIIRDNFTCKICGKTDIPLEVHHHYYLPSTDPWDYDNEILITLCDPCHQKEHFLKNFDTIAFQQLLNCGFTRQSIHELIGHLSKYGLPPQWW